MNIYWNQQWPAHIQYAIFLADNALILAQQHSKWCGKGPILEQDIALSNIALDYLGQARNFYQLAAEELNQWEGVSFYTEDSLAYHRTDRNFVNLLLTELEQPNWGYCVLKTFFYSSFTGIVFQKLMSIQSGELTAIAEKSSKELAYHKRWSQDWVIRLGDGTTESNTIMQQALNQIWPYVGECFLPAHFEKVFWQNHPSFFNELEKEWMDYLQTIFTEATLQLPAKQTWQTGGKQGIHTEQMGYVLAEMQYLQRTYPNSVW